MAKGLTKKEKGFVRDYIKTGNGTKAVLNNYDTDDENVAGSMASQNLGKLKIQNAIKEALPDELLAKAHLEGLNASKEVRNEDGEIVFEIPDFAVRHKYLDSAYKVKGSYEAEKIEHTGTLQVVGMSIKKDV